MHLKCPKCEKNDYVVVTPSKKVKKDGKILEVELRQCNNCFHRYEIWIDNGAERYKP